LPQPTKKIRTLFFFILTWLIGFFSAREVQAHQDARNKSTMSKACLPSAQQDGPCLLYSDIQKMVEDDPDIPDLRDVPAAISPNAYVEGQI